MTPTPTKPANCDSWNRARIIWPTLFRQKSVYGGSAHESTNYWLVKNPGSFLLRGMSRSKARFRISIKDRVTGKALKVELIEQPWPGRYWIRQNGRRPVRHAEGSLSMIFAEPKCVSSSSHPAPSLFCPEMMNLKVELHIFCRNCSNPDSSFDTLDMLSFYDPPFFIFLELLPVCKLEKRPLYHLQ